MTSDKYLFKKDQPIHIVARAIAEREIFKSEEDCFRFIYYLYVTNVGSPAYNLKQRDVKKIAEAILNGEEIPSKFIVNPHPLLVYLLDFSLVITHNHLYLVPVQDNGIPIYMQKLNTAFGKYISLKYGFKGGVFGRRYGRVRVETDFQSEAVSRYVSVINPLDVFQPGWREKGLKDWKKAFKFLENYQFSSFPDKIGKRKSKILVSPEIQERYLNLGTNPKIYKEFVKDFLKQNLKIPKEFFCE